MHLKKNKNKINLEDSLKLLVYNKPMKQSSWGLVQVAGVWGEIMEGSRFES